MVQVAILNLTLAHLIEEAVRQLYAPGEIHTTLFSSGGLNRRQQLVTKVDIPESRVVFTFFSARQVDDALEQTPYDVSVPFGALIISQ
jgi:hypothetical protein